MTEKDPLARADADRPEPSMIDALIESAENPAPEPVPMEPTVPPAPPPVAPPSDPLSLDALMAESERASAAAPPPPVAPLSPPSVGQPAAEPEEPQKPKKKSVRPADFLKFLGAVFVVALIFFGSFLAYIVFNPGQAQFFVSFGINPADIASLLSRLVSAIFGTLTFLLSVTWLVFLFRAIRTKKELRRRKAVSIILAVFFGLALFSGISLWAYLFQIIDSSDYENPGGGVVIYDNARLLSPAYKTSAKMTDFANLVGPIELKFDLSSSARVASRRMNIQKYTVDFDGDGKPDKEGSNPQGDQSIVYSYAKAGRYSPSIVYEGTNTVTGAPETASVDLPRIDVIAVVAVETLPQRTGGVKVLFDATALQPFGNVAWYVETASGSNDKPESTAYKFAPSSVFLKPSSVCLVLSDNTESSKANECARIFVVDPGQSALPPIRGEIVAEQDAVDPLSYAFSLGEDEGKLHVENGGIQTYAWKIDGKSISATDATLEYKFQSYGRHTVSVDLTDYVGNTVTLDTVVTLNEAVGIQVGKDGQAPLAITQEGGSVPSGLSYDASSRTYSVRDADIPMTLLLDARDVSPKSPLYVLDKIEWDLDGDGEYEATGSDARLEIDTVGRKTAKVRYTFISKRKADTQTTEETILVDARAGDISPEFTMEKSSDYVPVVVTVDASASRANTGSISKFQFDFGESGRAPQEGDAIQNYQYTVPGTYNVTLTVTRSDGKTASVTKKLILKSAGNRININTSVSSGLVGNGVDFDAAGSVGQITGYFWQFGDGQSSADPAPTHAYQEAGTYDVSLRATFEDGSVRDQKIKFAVK